MSRLHLVLGPVGAGKSTYATRLAAEHRAVRLTLDEWMHVLYGDDVRPAEGRIAWYVARTERCLELMRRQLDALLAVGTPVVLEPGLIQRAPRRRFCDRLDAPAHDTLVHVVDAERAVRRARVAARNREQGPTFFGAVPPDFFELASDLWEPPDDAEQRERPHVFIET